MRGTGEGEYGELLTDINLVNSCCSSAKYLTQNRIWGNINTLSSKKLPRYYVKIHVSA